MNKFESLDEGNKILYKDGLFSGDYNQDLYIKKSNDDGSNKPKFFISAYTTINGTLRQQGYIYFYLDYETKSSNFIGIKVESDYRNLNIASLLVASWIDFCQNNGYDFLGVHPKQRKPFLLYLLKTYGFEIFNKSLYDTRKDVITICRSSDSEDKRKLLLFKDPKHEKVFIGTKIYQNDTYEIIHDTDGIIKLDDIILPLQNMRRNPINYELLDFLKAKEKVDTIIARHTR